MKPVNGLASWIETHFEIVSAIALRLQKDDESTLIKYYHQNEGICGMYTLAEDLTDKFEKKFEDFEWDGEFFDEVKKFCNVELDKNLEDEEPDNVVNQNVCSECGSTNIEVKTWVNPNTNKIGGDAIVDDDDIWCNDCEKHVKLK